MTDPRLTRVIDVMFRAGGEVLEAPHCSTGFALGAHLVAVNFLPHRNHAGIPLDRAFLETPAGVRPDFTLTVIDDTVTRAAPRPDWPAQWHEPFGVVKSRYSQPYRLAVDVHSQSFTVFDPRNKHAIVWFHDVEKIEYWFAATPFRLQLSWFADTFGGEMIHAAGLEFGDEAALLVGPSGAGKSTLTLAAMLEGVRILGDDFLLLSDGRAQAVYRRTKFHDATLERFEDHLGQIGPVMNPHLSGQKRIVDTSDSLIRRESVPIAAVLVPRIGERARVSTLSRVDALRSVLGPTMMGLMGGSPGTLDRITSLVRTTPTFEIEVGPDMAANVRAIIELMGDLGHRLPPRADCARQ